MKELRQTWRGNNSGSSEDSTTVFTCRSKGESPDMQQTNLQESHNASPGWRVAYDRALDFNIKMW